MDCSCIVFFCGEYSAAEIVLLLLLWWGGGLNRNGQRIRPNQRQSKTKHNRRHGNAKNRRGKDENTARAVEFLQKVNRENGREIERERERDTCRERERANEDRINFTMRPAINKLVCWTVSNSSVSHVDTAQTF